MSGEYDAFQPIPCPLTYRPAHEAEDEVRRIIGSEEYDERKRCLAERIRIIDSYRRHSLDGIANDIIGSGE